MSLSCDAGIRRKTKLIGSRGDSENVVLHLPTQYRTNCENVICLTKSGTQICRDFEVHDMITCDSKVQVVV